MGQEIIPLTRRRRIEPYWYLIALLAVIGLALFIYNLTSGKTPDRVAVHISSFNFDVFWYGVIIVTGIAIGSWVTARLAADKAASIFNQHVPSAVQDRAVADLNLPGEILSALDKRRVNTVGKLLFEWGLNTQRLSLNKAGREVVRKKLSQIGGLKNSWLDDAPWRNWNPDYVWSGVAWCLAFGIVGARLYHVLTPSPSMAEIGIESAVDYFKNPMQLVNLRNGGLGIYGAIAGGALGIFLFTRRHHISAIAWMDLAVVGLALGQSIGRWANFINQELYGRPSDLPWAINIDPAHRLPEYLDVARFHPTFLYASIWSFITFVILLWLARNKRQNLLKGDLTALYLIMFSIGRITLEFFRLDSRTIQLAGSVEIPVATLVSILIALPLALLLFWRHSSRRNRDSAAS